MRGTKIFFNSLFLVLWVLILGGFALAAHVVRTSSNSLEFSVNEDVPFLYNLSVNNTDLGEISNITQVNITLPGGCSAISNSFSSSVSAYFGNNSNTLSWTNISPYLINGSGGAEMTYFAFSASIDTPGEYNLTVVTVNSTNVIRTNISVRVNDTTAPNINFVLPGYNQSINISSNEIVFNVTLTDNVGVVWVNVSLYNGTGNLVNFTSYLYSFYINYSNLTNSNYTLNISVGDAAGNVNSTIRRATLDSEPPILSISKTSSTETTIGIRVLIGDLSGAREACSVNRSGPTISGAGNTQIINESGLTCDTYYVYNITCLDYAGNIASMVKSYSTEECGSDEEDEEEEGGGGGDDTPSTGGAFWTSTFTYDDKEFVNKEDYSRRMKEHERVKIRVEGASYYIGIADVTSTRVKINVSANQQKSFEVGDREKFEVSGDNYYDLSIKLNEIINESANITLSPLHELKGGSQGDLPSDATTLNDSATLTTGTGNQTAPISGNVVDEGIPNKTLVGGIIAAALILGGVGYVYWRNRRKNMTRKGLR